MDNTTLREKQTPQDTLEKSIIRHKAKTLKDLLIANNSIQQKKYYKTKNYKKYQTSVVI